MRIERPAYNPQNLGVEEYLGLLDQTPQVIRRKLIAETMGRWAANAERDQAIADLVDTRAERDQAIAERNVAEIDQLTGLPNRRQFLQKYADFERAVELGGGGAFMVLLHFDIRDLHGINAAFGNPGGDKIIQLAAGMPHVIALALKKYLRSEDVSARMGGDEFMAALLVDQAAIRGSIPDFLVDLLQRFDYLTELQNMHRRLNDEPMQTTPVLRLHRAVTAITYDDLCGDPPKTFETAYEEIGLKDKESGREA